MVENSRTGKRNARIQFIVGKCKLAGNCSIKLYPMKKGAKLKYKWGSEDVKQRPASNCLQYGERMNIISL